LKKKFQNENKVLKKGKGKIENKNENISEIFLNFYPGLKVYSCHFI
jgi:hypothetical protein